MGRRIDNFRASVAELIDASRDEEPEPEGYQGEERASGLIRGGILEHEPDRDDLHFYRELYENVGPIKSAIDNYSSEVVEPGWYITSDSEDTTDKLTEYFKNVAILNTETNVNGSVLMETMVRERDIRGTIFLEKVTDSQDRNQALYPLQNDTITIYTKPGKAMLPAPDDSMAEPFDPDIARERDEPPRTAGGEMGAYVQFDTIKPKWSNTEEVVYTRDDVLKWVRDADIGSPRGTSRIASSAQRAEGLLEKLHDNDDAVKFKAWPQIIFELGDEDNPWTEEEVNNFIQHYDEGNLQPGLMQAVAGDVSVEEFAGDTADIEATLNFDISMIMSGLPGPVYATGGFSQNVAPAVAQAQQRQFVKEVKKTRRELEALITPYLREVAADYELDAADSVELHVGRPEGQVAPEDIEGNIIRYTTDVQNGDAPGQSSNQTTTGAGGGAAPQPGDAQQSRQAGQSNSSRQTETADMQANVTANLEPHHATGADTTEPFRFERDPDAQKLDVDELADPRLVRTSDAEDELADVLYQSLLSVREELLTPFEETGDRPLRSTEEMEGVATRAVQNARENAGVDVRSESSFEDIVQNTLDTLGQENHDPQLDVSLSARHRQRVRFLANNIDDSFTHVTDDMLESASVQMRQVVQREESPQIVADRVREMYTDDVLRRRAETIARTEAMNAVNSLKMAEYDRHDEIVGVKLINPCNTNTTPLCEHLACENEMTARFDANDTLGEQFEAEADDEMLFDGFDPLPTVPPFHFNCRTEIVPITE